MLLSGSGELEKLKSPLFLDPVVVVKRVRHQVSGNRGNLGDSSRAWRVLEIPLRACTVVLPAYALLRCFPADA